MVTVRPQWPHSLDDIKASLDGIWGLVGATDGNGNLWRLERSLHEPLSYTITQFAGLDEGKVVKKTTFTKDQRVEAIREFAQALGFSEITV
jgi:hypothetical protein